MTFDQLTESERAEIARLKRRAAIRWYVLYVRSNHERKVMELLHKKNIEAYVPQRMEKRKYSDRVVLRPALIVPGIVFVRISLNDKDNVYIDPAILGFMFDRTLREPEHIPDREMNQFMSIVDSDVHISMVKPMQGDMVRIIRGRFEGFVGQMVFDGNGHKFQIRLGEQAFIISVDANDVIKVSADSYSETPDERYH